MSSIILVEGRDDKHVINHLLGVSGIVGVEVREKESIEALLRGLGVELKSSGLERLAVMVDANASFDQRWQAIRDRLIHCGYNPVPESMGRNGLVLQQNARPTIGAWIMPDNLNLGGMEAFAATLVPAGDSLWDLACQAVEGIPIDRRRFRPQHQTKAQMHTWLAWQRSPGLRIGAAIRAGFLDPGLHLSETLVAWVQQWMVK
jgi:hypothetical protein